MHTEASSSRSLRPTLDRRSHSNSSKGKARADDDDVQATEGTTGLTFNVRFTDGKTEDVLSLLVGEKEAVREVKRRVRALFSYWARGAHAKGFKIRLLRPATLASRRLRLIYLGRILTDGVLLVPWTAALLERQKQYEAGQNRLLDDALVGLEGVVKSVTASGQEAESKGKGKAKGETTVEQKAIWLNCSVGEVEEPEATPVEGEQVRSPLSNGHLLVVMR